MLGERLSLSTNEIGNDSIHEESDSAERKSKLTD